MKRTQYSIKLQNAIFVETQNGLNFYVISNSILNIINMVNSLHSFRFIDDSMII